MPNDSLHSRFGKPIMSHLHTSVICPDIFFTHHLHTINLLFYAENFNLCQPKNRHRKPAFSPDDNYCNSLSISFNSLSSPSNSTAFNSDSRLETSCAERGIGAELLGTGPKVMVSSRNSFE